jgi:hypothetical protein
VSAKGLSVQALPTLAGALVAVILFDEYQRALVISASAALGAGPICWRSRRVMAG